MQRIGSSKTTQRSSYKKPIKQCRKLEKREIYKYKKLNTESSIDNKKIKEYLELIIGKTLRLDVVWIQDRERIEFKIEGDPRHKKSYPIKDGKMVVPREDQQLWKVSIDRKEVHPDFIKFESDKSLPTEGAVPKEVAVLPPTPPNSIQLISNDRVTEDGLNALQKDGASISDTYSSIEVQNNKVVLGANNKKRIVEYPINEDGKMVVSHPKAVELWKQFTLNGKQPAFILFETEQSPPPPPSARLGQLTSDSSKPTTDTHLTEKHKDKETKKQIADKPVLKLMTEEVKRKQLNSSSSSNDKGMVIGGLPASLSASAPEVAEDKPKEKSLYSVDESNLESLSQKVREQDITQDKEFYKNIVNEDSIRFFDEKIGRIIDSIPEISKSIVEEELSKKYSDQLFTKTLESLYKMEGLDEATMGKQDLKEALSIQLKNIRILTYVLDEIENKALPDSQKEELINVLDVLQFGFVSGVNFLTEGLGKFEINQNHNFVMIDRDEGDSRRADDWGRNQRTDLGRLVNRTKGKEWATEIQSGVTFRGGKSAEANLSLFHTRQLFSSTDAGLSRHFISKAPPQAKYVVEKLGLDMDAFKTMVEENKSWFDRQQAYTAGQLGDDQFGRTVKASKLFTSKGMSEFVQWAYDEAAKHNNDHIEIELLIDLANEINRREDAVKEAELINSINVQIDSLVRLETAQDINDYLSANMTGIEKCLSDAYDRYVPTVKPVLKELLVVLSKQYRTLFETSEYLTQENCNHLKTVAGEIGKLESDSQDAMGHNLEGSFREFVKNIFGRWNDQIDHQEAKKNQEIKNKYIQIETLVRSINKKLAKNPNTIETIQKDIKSLQEDLKSLQGIELETEEIKGVKTDASQKIKEKIARLTEKKERLQITTVVSSINEKLAKNPNTIETIQKDIKSLQEDLKSLQKIELETEEIKEVKTDALQKIEEKIARLTEKKERLQIKTLVSSINEKLVKDSYTIETIQKDIESLKEDLKSLQEIELDTEEMKGVKTDALQKIEEKIAKLTNIGDQFEAAKTQIMSQEDHEIEALGDNINNHLRLSTKGFQTINEYQDVIDILSKDLETIKEDPVFENFITPLKKKIEEARIDQLLITINENLKFDPRISSNSQEDYQEAIDKLSKALEELNAITVDEAFKKIILRINEKIEELKYYIYFDRFNEKINTYTKQSSLPDTSLPDIKTTEINNTLKTEVEKIKKEAQEDGLKIENTGLARNIEALIKVLEENKDKRVKFE